MKIYFCKAKSLPLPFSVITLGTDNYLLHLSGGGEGGYEGGILFLKNLHFLVVVRSRMSELTVSDDQKSLP